MSVLFGHAGGSPYAYNAALAHYEKGRLEALCIPWMPTPDELRLLGSVPGLANFVSRLERRCFPALLNAPRIEGRIGEWSRLLRRFLLDGWISSEALAYEANDWLMRSMKRECSRASITSVHAYEDCSLWQFEEAKRLGKACIYDMPIGYYPAWEQTESRLVRVYGSSLPRGFSAVRRFVRPEQKEREMELADLVLVPSTFAQKTIDQFTEKRIAFAPYGVDCQFWRPPAMRPAPEPCRFLYVGHCSIRKGTPLLLESWKKADLQDAELNLVGAWQLSEDVKQQLPKNVNYFAPTGPTQLRNCYQQSHCFVFPSFFEGFGFVILEAMACGLPVIATDATAAPDFLTGDCGRVIRAGDLGDLVDALRYYANNRSSLDVMSRAVREKAEECNWKRYRDSVSAAVAEFV